MTHDPKKYDVGELRRSVRRGALIGTYEVDHLQNAQRYAGQAGDIVRLTRERDEARAELERLRAECDLLAAAVAAALVPDRNGREVAGRDTFEDGAQHVRNKLVSTLADWPHAE
jgi:hypothetical protein